MEFDPTRWTIYLTLGPIAAGIFFLMRANWLRALVLIGALLFLDGVVLSWRPFFLFALSLSSGLAYTMFASLLLVPSKRARMIAFAPLWLAFLSFALIGAMIGWVHPQFGLSDQIPYFQFYYVEALLYFMLGRCAFESPEETNRVLRWLVVLGGVVAVLHLFTLATGTTFYTTSGGKYAGGPDAADLQTFRYGATFANPNTLADFYAMTIPAAIVLAFGWARPRGLALGGLLVAAGLMLLSLPLTASRGGMLATAVTLTVTLFLLPVALRQTIGLLAGGAIMSVIAAAGLFLLFPDFLDRTLERFALTGLQSERIVIWAITLQMLVQNPFGIGLSPYNYLVTIANYGIDLANPHSIYLGLASDAGFLGLAAFLGLAFFFLQRPWRARRSEDPQIRTAACAIFVMLLAFLLGGITEPIFKNGYKLHHIFFLLAGAGSFLPYWMRQESTRTEPLRSFRFGVGALRQDPAGATR